MKKIFFLLIFFSFVVTVNASTINISKRDVLTGEYVNDCDFLLVDLNDNVIDRWVQDSNYHNLSVSNGIYKIIMRPYMMGDFQDELSESIFLEVYHDMDVTLYNRQIDTPNNLKYKSFGIIWFLFFLFIGLFIIIFV